MSIIFIKRKREHDFKQGQLAAGIEHFRLSVTQHLY